MRVSGFRELGFGALGVRGVWGSCKGSYKDYYKGSTRVLQGGRGPLSFGA